MPNETNRLRNTAGLFIAAAGALCALPRASHGTEAGAIAPLDTRLTQTVQIIDSSFGQPMSAGEITIPAGWQTVGGVTWNLDTPCVANQMYFGWSAIAPDSLTAVEKMAGFAWQVAGTESQFNPCPSAPFRTAREFLEATALRLRPGAKVLDYEDISEDVRREMPPSNTGDVRWDAGRLLIAYEQDGIAMREILMSALHFTQMNGSIVAGTGMVDSFRAPAGRLDFELGRRIGQTARLNPQWQQATSQRQRETLGRHHQGISNSINDWHNREMAAINARGAADRHAIRMRGNQEVANIYSQIAANTSATNDITHAQSMDGLLERNTFNGHDGSTVHSSIHGGQRVFQDTRFPNHAYATDDPYHDPRNAVELQRRY